MSTEDSGLQYTGLTSSAERLETRREKNMKRFAEKTLKNPRYADKWFPKRDLVHTNRDSNIYTEEFAAGNRLYNSPLFAMRRLLNGNTAEIPEDFTGLFNDPFQTQPKQ